MAQDAPQGMPNIFPALSYRDAPAAIDWLARSFGFRKLMVVPNPDGTVAHAEMGLGPGVIMLGTAKEEKGWMSPRDLPAVNQSLYIYVEDLEEHYRRAKTEGAEIVLELRDTEYGSREYSAKDPEGHHWHFGTYLPDPAPLEVMVSAHAESGT